MLQEGFYVLVFLLGVAILAKVRSRVVRQAFLLTASYAVYLSWTRWFVLILLTSTVMNYIFGRWLRRGPSGWLLTIAIGMNLALLASFKYLPDISLFFPFASLQRFSHLALPIGISFWTFQAMSYRFDQYRGEDLDPSFVEFAIYMAFFPVTISGPICRLPDMLPQFRSEAVTSGNAVSEGFRRIAIGVLMMQLAKLLGQGILAGDGINSGFDRITHWSGPDVWCLAFGYGMQLFLDFAGYSHIAIGAAQALGFEVPENFARPFQSTTPSIFWTRWHMSLSFWIRDYVFLPLAMLRRELWWRNLALVVSMVLFGVWHKATALFVMWGCYHGILLFLHRQLQQSRRMAEEKFAWAPGPFWAAFSWIATISLISLGWILFRANSLSQAQQMLSALLEPASYRSHVLSGSLYLLILVLATSYALVVMISDTLNRYLAEPGSSEGDLHSLNPAPTIIQVLARWRWYWVPPLYALALIFVFAITVSRDISTAQMMYGKF